MLCRARPEHLAVCGNKHGRSWKVAEVCVIINLLRFLLNIFLHNICVHFGQINLKNKEGKFHDQGCAPEPPDYVTSVFV
jgi:hypothetical protein